MATTTDTIAVPKRITNAQTVCNEKNEKGKLCNGHLKQLKTAGEPAQVHLRGDDVLFKCQTCGTLYMGPPLGHVRDPYKQVRFVEAELSALLQAAGGTLPVVKKDERGVFVMIETEAGDHSAHAAKPAPAKAAASKTPAATAAPTAGAPGSAAPAKAPAGATAAAKAGEHKTLGQNPNRQLFKRSTYVGVKDTGPVAGETFEQKVARLKAVSVAAKQRQDEGGAAEVVETVEPSTPAASASASATVAEQVAQSAEIQAPSPAPTSTHKPTGNADRSLMKRSTYCGVKDTGPVPGESFEQKVARLAAVSAAAKQRADGG
jgi:hypothetical protein